MASRLRVFWIRKATEKVTMVAPFLTAGCQVSEKLKNYDSCR